jgi:adenosylcobinamide-GDP ribazoletransferase
MPAVSRALVAASYLTIVPLARRLPAGGEEIGRAAGWFPVVGAGIGAVLAVIDAGTVRLFPPMLAALLTITVWKLLTGGLHLDGLADCLDGLAGRAPEQRLAIMSDSRIGAFGAIGLILFLMLELAALTELAPGARWRALVAAPAIARATPPVLGSMFRPARTVGQGARFSAGLDAVVIGMALAVAIVVAVVALGWIGIVAGCAAVAAAVGFGALFSWRLDGVTGDVLGGGVEVAELVLLLVVSAWMHLRP